MKKRPSLNSSNQRFEKSIVEKYFREQEMDPSVFFHEAGIIQDKFVVNIPARSASTRLKNKNIRPLCGIPLMGYTIKMALAMGADRVIVNTDDKTYADVAESLGAEIPFLRPKELSGDNVSPSYATFYTLRHLMDEKYPVKGLIDMCPTNPFRNLQTMKDCYTDLKKYGYCATAAIPHSDIGEIYIGDRPLKQMVNVDNYREYLPIRLLSLFIGKCICFNSIHRYTHRFLNNALELIDIDYEEDFMLAEKIIKAGLYDFGVEIQ